MTNAISKRILAFALAIATVIAFTPAIAFTQSAHAADAAVFTIGGVLFTTDVSGNTVYGTTNDSGVVTNTGSTSTNYNIMWDGRTLTLKDATINGDADNYGAGIYYARTADITIDVEGTNTVKGADSSDNNAYGLYTRKALTFEGSGSLVVTGGTTTNGTSYGIYSAESTKVKGGTITATGGAAHVSSIGIYSAESMTVSGGSITGNGCNTTSSTINTFGIFCRSEGLTVSGGSAAGNGGRGLTNNYGIYYATTFNINGGSVTGKGEKNAVATWDGQGQDIIPGVPVLGANVTAYTATDTAGTTGINTYTSGTTLPTDAKFFKATYIPPVYPPTVTIQPTGGSYDIGGKVTPLKVAVSDSGAKYQWQQSADGTNWTNIDGATSPTYTPSVSASGSTKYRCLITGSNGASTYSDAVTITVSSRYAVGAKFTKSPLTFQVIKQPAAKTASASKNGTVRVVRPVKKTYKSITVPTSVKMNGYTYNVTTIGKKAFYKNSKLKTVTIKSTKITSIGSKAFKGCKKAMTIKVPKSKYKAYKKLLKGQVPAGTKIRKI